MDKTEENVLKFITATIQLVAVFAVAPFVLMFAWNTLATHLFGVMAIGYGGAWAITTLRVAIFPKVIGNDDSAERSLEKTIQSCVNLGLIALVTLIVGIAIGAI